MEKLRCHRHSHFSSQIPDPQLPSLALLQASKDDRFCSATLDHPSQPARPCSRLESSHPSSSPLQLFSKDHSLCSTALVTSPLSLTELTSASLPLLSSPSLSSPARLSHLRSLVSARLSLIVSLLTGLLNGGRIRIMIEDSFDAISLLCC
ncbi:hypothetical protein AAHE18_15G202400 [Arachis hypogaea]